MSEIAELEEALAEARQEGAVDEVKILSAAIETLRGQGPATRVSQREKAADRSEARRQQQREVTRSLIGNPMGLPNIQAPTGMEADLLLEAGIPMAAQAVATPLTPAGQSVVGGISSGVGNVLAQLRRLSVGEQEEFSKGQLTAATATGAIPFVGPAKTGSGILRKAGEVALGAGQMAASGVAGKAIETGIDEGRLPTQQEATVSAALPAAFGLGLPVAARVGRALTSAGGSLEEMNKVFSTLDAKPTPGMLAPESLASIEALKAARAKGGDIAKAVDDVYSSLAEGVQNVAGSPQQRAAIGEAIKPMLGRVTAAQEEVTKLGEKAVAARKAESEAWEAYRQAQGTAKEETLQKAQKLSEEAFTESRNAVLENAKAIALEELSATPMNEAVARTLRAEYVAKPLREAVDAQAAALYEGVDNLSEAFDTKPIMAVAEQAAKEGVTGQLPKRLLSDLNVVQDELGSGKASLQSLRNVRSQLLKSVQVGDIKTSAGERLVKQVIHEITDQINNQAVKALGPEMGERLLAANQFYRQKSELFDAPGMDVLFDPNSASSGRILAAIEKSGKDADEFRNVQRSIAFLSEFDPELASTLKGTFNSVVRGSIMQKALGGVDATTGARLIDGETLAKNLEAIEVASPGTMKALGLGDGRVLGQLKTLFAKYPDAPQMSAKQWEELFAQPAFQSAASVRPIAENIERTLATASADSKLSRAAQLLHAGKKEQALQRYNEALAELEQVDANLMQANTKFEMLVKDPVARAFDNPNLGEGDFNTLAKSLFDPKAGKVKIEDVREIASALRQSGNEANKAVLARLQERYIADRIASFKEFSQNPESVQRPTVRKLSDFFNPYNPKDADNEISVARALLEPEQMSRLEKFADVAEVLNRYEKFSSQSMERLSREAGVRGSRGGLVDLVQELWQRGKYSLAARYLANPQMAASRTKFAGEALELAGSRAGAQAVKQGARVEQEEDAREREATP